MRLARVVVGAWVALLAGCGAGGVADAPDAADDGGHVEDASPGPSLADVLFVELTASERARVVEARLAGSPPESPTNAWADDPAAARLGQYLFYDGRLSADGQVPCAACHDPALDWGDAKQLSEGLGTTGRNAPTLWNVAFNRWFFWDGRADSAWSQALGPIESGVEMGMTRAAVAHLVAGDLELAAAYEGVFGPLPDLSDAGRFPAQARPVASDPFHPHQLAWDAMEPEDQHKINVVFSRVGKAIGAYERLIIQEGAAFDTFVDGLLADDAEQISALDASAQRGMKLFFSDELLCFSCHAGPNFTDREFHNIALGPIPGLPVDQGRWAGITKLLGDPFNGLGAYSDDTSVESNKALFYLALKPNNEGEYKTPTLRNIALTAPYMHDGRFDTLDEVVEHYVEMDDVPAFGHKEETLQPLVLTEDEVSDLLAFLESLTGDPLDESLTAQPASPLLTP